MTVFQSIAARILVVVFTVFGISIVPAQSDDGLSSPFFDGTGDGKWAATLFVGQLTENELSEIIIPRGTTFTKTSFAGGALSREIYRWHGFSVEAEAGAGFQFGGGSGQTAGHVWGALYGRYNDFPWNDYVKTSVAISVGLNYMTDETDFENQETAVGDTEKLLHYLSPEVTFAMPDNENQEFVVRLHHRSSADGFFGCDGCGSNIIAFGFRQRF